MSVRAKFYVTERTEHNGTPEPTFTIRMCPVTSGSKENEDFYKWTPSGNLVLATVNALAAEQFKPGKQFYLDFTPAVQEST